MTDKDRFIKLALRHAERREIPFRIIKLFLGCVVLFMAFGVLQNCAQDHVKPLTPGEKKTNVDALWSGNEEAHKKRLP